jgi:hypothetical protein
VEHGVFIEERLFGLKPTELWRLAFDFALRSNILHHFKEGKSHNTPMEAQGERMYSSYSFTKMTLHGDKWSASHPWIALSNSPQPETLLPELPGLPLKKVWKTDVSAMGLSSVVLNYV